MFTVHFEVPRLRPDFARFDTDAEVASAVDNLINRRFAGRPIIVCVRSQGLTVYRFERK